jgi:hypothetical protein
VAPEWTSAAIERFKAWLAQHGGKALVIALTVIGALLIVRGIVAIVS